MKIIITFIVIILISYILDFVKDRKFDFSMSMTAIKIVLSLFGAFALGSIE